MSVSLPMSVWGQIERIDRYAYAMFEKIATITVSLLATIIKCPFLSFYRNSKIVKPGIVCSKPSVEFIIVNSKNSKNL